MHTLALGAPALDATTSAVISARSSNVPVLDAITRSTCPCSTRQRARYAHSLGVLDVQRPCNSRRHDGSRSYSTHPRSARSRCNCSDHDGKLWRWGKSRHSRATRRPRILAHYVFSAHPIALDAPAFDSATSPTLTCARAQVKSRAYTCARYARAGRDEHMAVLSARSSFSTHTLVPDAPALDATTCSMRSRTRRARCTTISRWLRGAWRGFSLAHVHKPKAAHTLALDAPALDVTST